MQCCVSRLDKDPGWSKIVPKIVLKKVSVVNPDPHSFACPGSRSALEMQIRIQKHENEPKFAKKPIFLPFQNSFLIFLGTWYVFDLLPA
jgi:hypothetical protein